MYMYSANRTDKLMIEMRRGDGAGGAGVDIGLSQLVPNLSILQVFMIYNLRCGCVILYPSSICMSG